MELQSNLTHMETEEREAGVPPEGTGHAPDIDEEEEVVEPVADTPVEE